MVALTEDRGDRTKRRRHAGRRTHGCRAALERGDALFENGDRRVRDATVGMPAAFQIEYGRCRVRIRKNIRRCLVYGRRARTELVIDGLSGV